MAKVLLKDVVQRIKDKVDKDNTELEYYIGGEHFDYGEICITKRGVIAGSTIGPAFHMQFKPGDVLLMSRNPHLRKAGVVDFEGICSDVSYVCRTKDENVLLQRYLPFIFQTDDFWNFAEQNKHGSTNFFLNWSDFEKYEFELPEIEEQKRLTELLWSAQDTKTAYQELLRQTDELVKSQFIEMFGDPELNPKSWPIKSLSEVAESFIGLTYKPKDVSPNGTIVLRSSNIQDSEIYLDDQVRVNTVIKEKLYVEENDILMCSRNGSASLVGKVAKIPKLSERMTFGAFMTIIRSRYSDYLFTYFQLPAFRKQVNTGTATINQITQKMLDNVRLPIPEFSAVERFSKLLTQTDKSKVNLQKGLKRLENTKNMIIQSFSNERRIKNAYV